MEWMVEIPERKGGSEAKDPKELPDWFSLINADKAVPKPLIQSSALLNRGNGPWHGPPCASSSDCALRCKRTSWKESAERGKGRTPAGRAENVPGGDRDGSRPEPGVWA